ncbi:class I SAM-dependent methyltransferase [Myxococcota bacterium]|nr:class I SAM-dependent methyltransferase [Myxococcota bacterium]MBU1382467.1 class I SAM-dependent methyltransferase [Myxococcota bacterium]MBU1498670.1 class I SAM-dependent methyltransferase [Myxococcota bacterium]
MKADYRNSRSDFFDNLAPRWDEREHMDELKAKLAAAFLEFDVKEDEHICDIGCGTGNLTQALLEILGPSGHVAAIDISPVMIDIAREKITDSRAQFLVETSDDMPFTDNSFHRVFCLSVWPHLENYSAHIQEFQRVLKPGGFVHVWHVVSRAKIDEIHSRASGAVINDVLMPAEDTAGLFKDAGFEVVTVIDDSERYLVTAVKSV